jgi:sugar (pentulose or hexulose) kinase
VIEGICYSLYNTVAIMEKPKTPISTVYVSGGFTRSTEWVRMLGDLFDIRTKVSGKGDASSIGAVFMGMRALKMIDSWKATSRYLEISATYRPRKRQRDIYRRNYEVFSRMYGLLKPTMHRIADWQDAGHGKAIR